MKEEALKKGAKLLSDYPELSETELNGIKGDLGLLCELLKANAIPTKKWDLQGIPT